jgi:YVTN family beta-propeller protein
LVIARSIAQRRFSDVSALSHLSRTSRIRAMGAGPDVELLILGPLEVRVAGVPAKIGGGRQRALLAMLLLHANTVVSRERLIDELLDGGRGDNGDHALRVQVSRLRAALGAAGIDPGRLVAQAPGYLFRVAPGELDLDKFQTLVAEGHEAARAGEHELAATRLRAAESSWRGPPLVDVQSNGFERGRLEQLLEFRLTAAEERIDAELALGRHSLLVGELEAHVAEHPFRERLLGQLMLALYRTGRQAEALEAYRNGRSRLIEELGLEPGREVRDLQARILRQDPDLDAPALAISAPSNSGTRAMAPPPANARAARSHKRAIAAFATIVAAVLATVIVLVGAGDGRSAEIDRVLRAPGLGAIDATSGHPLSATALASAPTRLTSGFGSEWATSYDAGTLMRIDPEESSVTQTVPVGTGATGVATAAGDVWVADSLADSVDRVNAGTNQVVQTIPVGSDPTEVAAGAGAVWVANTRDGTVSRIDPRSGAVNKVIAVGPSPDGLAVGDGSVWVALGGASGVDRLDPASGAITQTIPVGSGPSAIALDRAGVWVANTLDSTVSLINPRTDTVVLTHAVPGAPDAMASTGSSAWIAGGTSQLTLLSSAGTINTITTPSPVDALATNASRLLIGVVGTGAEHRGGTLHARISDPAFEPFDPAQCCDIPLNVLGLSYDGLLGFSKSPSDPGRLVPDLALAIPAAQDMGLTYTFRLRPGLRYWNGAPVRATDFVRGLELAAEDPAWAAYLGALPHASACANTQTCNLAAAIQANDQAGTVTLRLTHPDPNLLTALGQPAFAPDPGGVAIRPGTGPYRVTQQVVGHFLVFERNRYFHEWSPAAQPSGYPDKIVVRVDGTASADVAAVAAGRADWTFDTPTQSQLAAVELRTPGLLHRYQALGTEWADLNTRVPPFNDLRVRQALNYAIDRDAIVTLSGGPQLAAPQCQIIPPTMPGYAPYCPYTRHPSTTGRWSAPDLARARRLIAVSGTAGIVVSVTVTPSQPAGRPVAAYVVRLLRALGYRARLYLAGTNTVLDDTSQDPQLNINSSYADVPSPSEWLTVQLSCAEWQPPTATVNHAEFCDRTLDQTAGAAAQLQTTDPVAADRLWAKADREATNRAPRLTMVSFSGIDTVSPRVGDYQYVPTFGALLDRLWVH